MPGSDLDDSSIHRFWNGDNLSATGGRCFPGVAYPFCGLERATLK